MSLLIKNLSKSYLQAESKIEILKNFHLDIKKNEVVSILGQSGSGKSTLLTLISGLDSPDSGEIFIDGENIVGKTEQEKTDIRSRKIGIVFQNFHLMPHLTALENVMLPLEITNSPRPDFYAKEILEKMGLGTRLEHLPSQLSGGECQRVAIARALVIKPSILLADEPSGSLDEQTGKKVMSVLLDVLRSTQSTAIVVTHNEEISKMCDREVRLTRGAT